MADDIVKIEMSIAASIYKVGFNFSTLRSMNDFVATSGPVSMKARTEPGVKELLKARATKASELEQRDRPEARLIMARIDEPGSRPIVSIMSLETKFRTTAANTLPITRNFPSARNSPAEVSMNPLIFESREVAFSVC